MLRHQHRVDSLDVLLELLHVPFELGSPVLEPRDHLGITEAQLRGDLVAIRRTQVFLIEKALFQLEDLLIGEGRSALALLLRLLPIVEQVEVVRLFCNQKQ